MDVRDPDSPAPEKVERIWREIIEVDNPFRQAELVMRYGFDPVMEAMFAAAKGVQCNMCNIILVESLMAGLATQPTE